MPDGGRDALSRQPEVTDKDLHVIWTDGGNSVQVEESSGGRFSVGERKTIFPIETSVKKCLDSAEEQRSHQKISKEPRHCIQKDNQAGSYSLATNGKVSNGMQPASGVKIVHSLSNPLPTPETLNEQKQLPCSNKFKSPSLENIQYCVKPAGDFSHPMTQLAGQRPKKFSQKWKEDFASPVSDDVKAHLSFEGSPPSNTSIKLSSLSGYIPLAPRKDYGAGENNLKKVDDKAVDAVQKASPLVVPVKENMLLTEKEKRGVSRKGQNGRGLLPSGKSVHQEKLEKQPATNSLQNMKLCLNKNRRKTDRSPLKELLDCNNYMLPGTALNGVSSNITGELDDDHEELLEAANYARCASYHACSSPFWKRIEPIFAPVSSDDMTYLHKQLNLTESYGTDCLNFSDKRDVLGDEHLEGINSSFGGLDAERRVEKNVPTLHQLLLSALIEEYDAEGSNNGNENEIGTSQSATEYHPSDKSICSSVKPNDGNMMDTEAGESAKDRDDLLPSEVEMNCQSPQNKSERCVSDIKYQNLSFDERCLLELQSIDIYPEPFADEIDTEITELQDKRDQQLREMQEQMGNLEERVLAREAEGCDREPIALDRLVEIACRKCMASSRRKAKKDLKQKSIAFAKRTIGRCREYENTGSSCFSGPALSDFMSSTPQCSSVANLGETEPDKAVVSTRVKHHCPRSRPPSSRGFVKSQPKLKRVRKRKATDVTANSNSKTTSATSKGSGQRGTSKKDKDRRKSKLTTNSTAKASLQIGDSKGTAKRKTKSKLKSAQLPTSGNTDPDNVTGTTHSVPLSLETSNGTTTITCTKASDAELASCSGSSAKKNELIDIEDLNLPDIDRVDLGLPNFSYLANLDDVVLQDCDSVGLDIPMDNLSDLDLFF